MTNEKVMEFMNGQMVENTRDIGRMINKKVKEFILIKKVRESRHFIKKEKKSILNNILKTNLIILNFN
jgi:hypothetical protein